MNGTERLRKCEEELKARGVDDVKFSWGDITGKSAEELKNSAANVLEMVLQGKFSPMPPIGDSKGRRQ